MLEVTVPTAAPVKDLTFSLALAEEELPGLLRMAAGLCHFAGSSSCLGAYSLTKFDVLMFIWSSAQWNPESGAFECPMMQILDNNLYK